MECIEFLKRDVKDILLMFQRKFSKKKLPQLRWIYYGLYLRIFEERGNKVLLLFKKKIIIIIIIIIIINNINNNNYYYHYYYVYHTF